MWIVREPAFAVRRKHNYCLIIGLMKRLQAAYGDWQTVVAQDGTLQEARPVARRSAFLVKKWPIFGVILEVTIWRNATLQSQSKDHFFERWSVCEGGQDPRHPSSCRVVCGQQTLSLTLQVYVKCTHVYVEDLVYHPPTEFHWLSLVIQSSIVHLTFSNRESDGYIAHY